MNKMISYLQAILVTFLLLMLASFIQCDELNAQTSIPNGNFETWSSATFETPLYYPYTSNSESFFRLQTGFVNVAKVTPGYHGSYALQLTTFANGKDTAFGYALNNLPEGNPFLWTGGIPYSQKPTGMRGYYKTNMMNGDSGLIIAAFSKSGANIGTYVKSLGGVQNSYSLFSMAFSLALAAAPDSVLIGFISSNVLAGINRAGSTITLDSVSFVGVNSQPAGMNGDFELWQPQTVTKPTGWLFEGNGSGNGMNRTADAVVGSYAVELKTILRTNENGSQEARAGRISTGWYPDNCSGNCPEEGGYPFSNQIDTLAFYYKYAPSGNGTAIVQANFKKNGLLVGGFSLPLPAAGAYQYVEYPFYLNTVPDTVIIDLRSNNYMDTAFSFIGSDLKIDEIHFKSQPLNTGILNIEAGKQNLMLYPNPIKTSAILEIDRQIVLEKAELYIYDLCGRMVKTILIPQHKITFHKDNLSGGMYFYEVLNNFGILQSGRIVVE